MWKSDFESRKEYLIRSMFQDVPLLSPVPEEEESFDSPRPHRSYSPLPPLIIEPAPIINLHDEPEEYYIQLEEKMLRVYRRLFLENRSDISDLSGGEGSSLESNDAAEHTQSDTRRGLKRSSSSETDACNGTRTKISKSDNDISSSSEVLPKTSEDDFNYEESSISSDDGRERNGIDEESDSAEEEQYIKDRDTDETDMSESRDCIQVTFQAEVHREVVQNDDDLADVNNEAEHNDDLANNDQEIELLENNAVSETNPTGSRPSHDVEIMRTPQIHPSIGSLPGDLGDNNADTVMIEHIIEKYQPTTLENHSPDLAHLDNEHGDDLANKDINSLENNAVSETNPNGSRPGQEAEIMRTPRKYPSIGSPLDLGVNNTDIDISSSSSYSDSTKYQDKGVQTSLGYEQQNKDLLKSIFVGMPRVFRLCYCSHHICSC